MRSRFFVIFIFVFSKLSFGQDSIKVFSKTDLLWYVTKYHPVSKQANIQIGKGENEVRKAKGNLDPSLFSNFNQKLLNNEEYYRLFSGGLKVPTWYGLDFNAGFDQNRGLNLNPENKTSGNGLLYAGVSLPIGLGLFIDKRRAAIKQASLYAKSTYMEQALILNALYYEALQSYVVWVNYYNQMQLYLDAVNLAKDRFIGIKQSHKGGDIPAIDTLEAYIQVQIREVNLNQARLNYQNATFDLSNFLWFENNTPLEITNKIRPPILQDFALEKPISNDSLNTILYRLKSTHPQLQWYSNKVDQLNVERKWNAEQLKPNLNLKYNFLNEVVGNEVFNGFSANNYIWGVDFSIPIFLRESRGRLNISKIKIQETKLETDKKWLELSNKIKLNHNKLIALEEQIKIFSSAAVNYRSMLDAERQKFSAGESSVFLINSREAAYVQAAIKLIELNITYHSTTIEFKLASARW